MESTSDTRPAGRGVGVVTAELRGTFEVLRYAAFTKDGVGGNPAGVVLDAAGISNAERLAIAAELGYSETAFLETGRQAGEHRLRFFSPRAEVAFCGHATIAAAVAVAERMGGGTLSFETLAGTITVRTTASEVGFNATLTSVPTRSRPATGDELDRALHALRWQHSDLDLQYPVRVAYAGNDHLVLAVQDRARLAHLDYAYEELDALMAEREWTTLQLVHAHSPVLFAARNPFPPGGVVEDPTTGAAAAAFGGYLRELGALELPATVTLLQGEDMGRPSLLTVGLRADGNRVDVTGAAAQIV